MKSVLAFIAAGVAMVAAAPDPNFHIYVLLGQSNMEGNAPIGNNRISHSRVQVLQSQAGCSNGFAYGQWRRHEQCICRCAPSGGGLGPGDSFAVAMADANPNIKIGLVGTAYGGAKIENFLKNCNNYGACTPPYGTVNGAPQVGGTTPLYQWALTLSQKAQESGVIKGFIFHQGESNSGQSTWLGYVNDMISTLRSDLGLSAANTPFIAGELPRTGCCAGHNSLVQQIPNRVSNGHWVSSGPKSDGTVLKDKGDGLHWDADAVIEMGKRYAAKMLEVQPDAKATPSPTPTPTTTTPRPTPTPTPSPTTPTPTPTSTTRTPTPTPTPTSTPTPTPKPSGQYGFTGLACNYEGQVFRICRLANAWSYEQGAVCVGVTRCVQQSPPYGVFMAT